MNARTRGVDQIIFRHDIRIPSVDARSAIQKSPASPATRHDCGSFRTQRSNATEFTANSVATSCTIECDKFRFGDIASNLADLRGAGGSMLAGNPHGMTFTVSRVAESCRVSIASLQRKLANRRSVPAPAPHTELDGRFGPATAEVPRRGPGIPQCWGLR